MRALTLAALGLATLSPLVDEQVAAPRSTQRGSTPASAARKVESPVPFRVGETLTYDVSWSSFIVAGTAVTTVKEKKPASGSTAYYVTVEGRPVPLVARLYSVYYKMESYIDAYGLLSQRGSIYSEEGTDRRTTTTRFDRAARRAYFEQKTDTTVTGDYAVPALTQDGLSAFLTLRARTFKAGERVVVPVADSGNLFSVAYTVGAPEFVSAPVGRLNAWKLNLTITDSKNEPVWQDLAIWISNDARRLPVKMQAKLPLGSFVFELREAR